ncbi:Fur family transcriptional regulator [Cellvibrio japonicus]|nr:Fur family transcriptional regulator [Cellvibrio japonicus]QEI14315.1 transcriptional repressor [Cellvibrio japonicus]QEI17892.1 transcriptional repressor [Cellvibrio japonicus]QEI21468.1 transcriptional repressor [Cellvibrio japonicus]
MTNPPLACSHHDHGHCISDALADARDLCASRGVRLTDLRLQVLELIWQSHKPLGAYSLMEMLAAASTRRVAPPTVYRALDFLLEQGLIHRINALNAFIGCPSPRHHHQSYFLICRVCGNAAELDNPNLSATIEASAEAAGFSVQTQSLEVMGICGQCSKEQRAAPQ